MPSDAIDDQRELMRIFLPEALERRERAVNNATRFVHYTSASAAASIIRSNSVWLRNATTMNDYSEIQFGIERVTRNLGRRQENPNAKRFWNFLGQIGGDVGNKLALRFDAWILNLRTETYIFCVSEHDKSEDELGRLSMWRAYGGRNSVAAVFYGAPFHTETNALDTYTYPVLYFTPGEKCAQFEGFVERLENSISTLKEVPPQNLEDFLFLALETYSICAKHKGFDEEKEWRLVHQPLQSPNDRVRPIATEIRGAPQVVYSLPLRNAPEEGLSGIELNEILDRLIIGPSDHPYSAFKFFVQLLEEHGVTDAAERVQISNIPLRL